MRPPSPSIPIYEPCCVASKLSRILFDTLPERLVTARQHQLPYQDWLLQVLSDEVSRRDTLAVILRVAKAQLDPAMHLEAWDATAKVTLDRGLLNELVSLRFLDTHAHVAIVGPVGVGKTFLAQALGHIACRRGASVLALRTDHMLKRLKQARLDNSYDTELRRSISVDLLVLDDFAIDTLDATESRDLYEILLERYRTGSIVVTSSNRGPDEWLATFADPIRAQSAIDRFTSNAYDLVIEGESYRPRLKPDAPRGPEAPRPRAGDHARRIGCGTAAPVDRTDRGPPSLGHLAKTARCPHSHQPRPDGPQERTTRSDRTTGQARRT